MRRIVSLLAALSGCAAPPGPSPPPTGAAPQPPATARAPAEPAPDDDAVPSAEPEPAPDARPNPLLPDADAGPPPSEPKLSPVVRAGGAIMRKHPMFDGRQIVLLKNRPTPASCSLPEGDPEIVMSACAAEQDQTCVSQIVSIHAGVTTSYRARITALQMPKKKGARGRIQLEESAEMNVYALKGGVVEVLVCD